MNEVEKEGRALEQAIARRIREMRKKLGWTLDNLARVTGLSKGYLSQIENNEKTPPIGTLTKLAFGLGINVVHLITGEPSGDQPKRIALGRLDRRIPINRPDASFGSVYESFAFNKPDRHMDAYVITVSPDYPPQPMVHEGQEFLLILEGEQEFYYDGRTYLLGEGDAAYFDSNRPHMGRSSGDKPGKVLVVFSNPRKRG